MLFKKNTNASTKDSLNHSNDNKMQPNFISNDHLVGVVKLDDDIAADERCAPRKVLCKNKKQRSKK